MRIRLNLSHLILMVCLVIFTEPSALLSKENKPKPETSKATTLTYQSEQNGKEQEFRVTTSENGLQVVSKQGIFIYSHAEKNYYFVDETNKRYHQMSQEQINQLMDLAAGVSDLLKGIQSKQGSKNIGSPDPVQKTSDNFSLIKEEKIGKWLAKLYATEGGLKVWLTTPSSVTLTAKQVEIIKTVNQNMKILMKKFPKQPSPAFPQNIADLLDRGIPVKWERTKSNAKSTEASTGNLVKVAAAPALELKPPAGYQLVQMF